MKVTKVVTPVVAVQKSQLKDDLEAKLTANGFSLKDLERLQKQQEYREKYNQREEVRERRKQYQKERYERMKLLKSLIG